MDRRRFIGRAAVVLAGVIAGRNLELLEQLPITEPVVDLAWPEGTFLLDGGTLELGIIRDSVLNSTNDFLLFGETFENTAKLGWVTTAA